MQRILLLACVLLTARYPAFAQTSEKPVFNQDTTHINHEESSPLFKNKPDILKNVNMNFLLRSSLEMPDGETQAGIRMNEARIEVLGTIVPDLDFRVRWRLNRSQGQRSLDNAPSALDIASVNYRFGRNKKWSVNVGKQAAFVGSWEFETNPTYEYQYSEFVNYQTNLFMLGMKLAYQANENHSFQLQLHNTLNETFDVLHASAGYSYNQLKGSKNPMGVYAIWQGKMFDEKFQTFWSYDISQYASGKTNHSIALGNKVVLKKFKAYLDLQNANLAVDYPNIASPSVNNYRQYLSPFSDRIFMRDVNYKSAILRMDYEFVPGWFATAKGYYESASQRKNSSAAGKNFRENIGWLLGLEYKPIASQNMKFFGYYYNNRVNYNNAVALANADSKLNLFAIGVLYLVNAF